MKQHPWKTAFWLSLAGMIFSFYYLILTTIVLFGLNMLEMRMRRKRAGLPASFFSCGRRAANHASAANSSPDVNANANTNHADASNCPRTNHSSAPLPTVSNPNAALPPLCKDW